MASEEETKDDLAQVDDKKEESTEKNDAAASDAKEESSDDKKPAEEEKEVKLYVGNLPDHCRRGALQELFEKYGKVSQCDIVKNYAFVHMVGKKNAEDALNALDDSEFSGTHIQVQYAKTKGKPSEDQCFSCGKCGHWAKDCPKRRYDQRRNYDYGPPRRPYYRGPPSYYDPYMDRRPPYPRDYGYPGYGGGYGYRSRSPPRSPPRFSGAYEGYPRDYGSRRY